MISRVNTATRMARFGGAQALAFQQRGNPAATLVRFRPTAAFDEAAQVTHRMAPKKLTLIGEKVANDGDYVLPHFVYSDADVQSVKVTQRPVINLQDKVAYGVMKVLRTTFDAATGYGTPAHLTKAKYLNRMILLESVAGIPGLVGAMVRHLRSLRTMKRDGGWIHSLMEEAENERMHLLTFLEMRQPGPLARLVVLGAQGVVFNLAFVSYLLSPTTFHRWVGFLETEAVSTYTGVLQHMDAGDGDLGAWAAEPAPAIAVRYWRLKPGATVRDLMLAVRADEAIHRDVNHTLADIGPDAPNPFA